MPTKKQLQNQVDQLQGQIQGIAAECTGLREERVQLRQDKEELIEERAALQAKSALQSAHLNELRKIAEAAAAERNAFSQLVSDTHAYIIHNGLMTAAEFGRDDLE